MTQATTSSAHSFASNRTLPFLLLGFTALTWGSNWVLARALHLDIPPLTMAFGRWAVAWVAMLPFALAKTIDDWPRIKAGWRPIVVLGLLGTTTFGVFGYIGIQSTTAMNAVLINGATPVFTLLLSALLLGAKITARFVLAVVLSLAGLVCIAARGDLDRLASLTLNVGDLWVLGAMFFWACYTIGLRWRPEIHPLSFLFATGTVGLIACAPLYGWELAQGLRPVISMPTVLGMSYLGVISTFLAYICWNVGAPKVGPQVAGLFSNLIPVFGLIFAVIFLGEQLEAYHVIGMALVFSAVYLVSRSKAT